MRKCMLLSIVMIVMLCGCSSSHSKAQQESLKNYESYIDAVINNNGIESKSIPFDYKLNVVKKNDNTYEYEVIISNPQVAMYKIQAIAVDQNMDANTNVYPCFGLVGEDAKVQFNMIPYQVNTTRNYISGFGLNSLSASDQFTVNVMVTWKDALLQNTYRAFFDCNYVKEAGDEQSGEKTTSDKGQNKPEDALTLPDNAAAQEETAPVEE